MKRLFLILSLLFALPALADTRVVVQDGDSMTAGWPGGGGLLPVSWSWRLTMPGGPWTNTNVGVSGDTICNMVTTFAAKVQPKFNGAALVNVLTILAGSNDMAVGGLTPAATYSCLVAYGHLAQAAGFKLVVISMPSRTGNNPIGGETVDTDKNAYNALIAAGWPTFADAYVVLPATLTADGAFANGTFFLVDGIHPNQNSNNTIISPLMSTTITGLAPAGPHFIFQQIAADNFNRANENPLVTPPWTIIGGVANNLQVVSNAAEAAVLGGLPWELYTTATWPNDQYGQITITTAINTATAGPSVRGSTAARTSYELIFANTGSPLPNTFHMYIQKNVAGGITNLTPPTGFDVVVNAGDVLIIGVIGTTIYGFQNGVWRLTITDASIASGSPGFLAIAAASVNNLVLDDFSGGFFGIATGTKQVGPLKLVGPETVN